MQELIWMEAHLLLTYASIADPIFSAHSYSWPDLSEFITRPVTVNVNT
jgi:hypothetical protein